MVSVILKATGICGFGLVWLLSASAFPAAAQPVRTRIPARDIEPTRMLRLTQSPPNTRMPDPTAAEEARTRMCRIRENIVTQRMERLDAFVTNMISKFDAIAARVKTYYAATVLPRGRTVAEYDRLVTAIDTEKIAVTTAFTQAQARKSGFACEGGNPREMLLAYHEDMRTVKDALEKYRTAIRNLIVAVHSTAEAEE